MRSRILMHSRDQMPQAFSFGEYAPLYGEKILSLDWVLHLILFSLFFWEKKPRFGFVVTGEHPSTHRETIASHRDRQTYTHTDTHMLTRMIAKN